jgi:hypothetical protein
VFAYSTNGGLDRAQLYDSAGDDLFNASPAVTSIVGQGFSTFARGFSEVEAIANAGGNDRAVIHYSGASQVLSSSDSSGVINNSRTSIARYFEQVQVSAVTSPASTSAALRALAEDGNSSLTTEDESVVGASGSLVSGPAINMAFLREADSAFADSSRSSSGSSESDGWASNVPEYSWFDNQSATMHEAESQDLIRLEMVEEKLERLDSLIGVIAGCESEDELLIGRSLFFAQYR